MDTEAVVRRWVELYNDGTPETYGSDRFLELYADDCVWRELPTALTPDGRGGDKQALRVALEFGSGVFVDRRVEISEVLTDGDRAAMRYVWSATVKMDLGPDLPSAGTRVQVGVASFMRVVAGLIREATDVISAPLPGRTG